MKRDGVLAAQSREIAGKLLDELRAALAIADMHTRKELLARFVRDHERYLVTLLEQSAKA